MSNQLSWTEAEIFNARFESYDVYRAVQDAVTGEPGDFALIATLPIFYGWDMELLSQTLEYLDEDVDAELSYVYKVVANASNGAGDPDGDFTQVSNLLVLAADTNFLLQEDLFSILQEDGFNILIVSAPPGTGVNLNSHVVTSYGGNGSGAQEPLITMILGGGDDIELGKLYIGGGGLGFPNLTIDGVDATFPDPEGLRQYGRTFTNEWWDLVAPPDGAAYEVRVTSLNGPAPLGDPLDTWLTLDVDRFWQYFGVFNDIPQIGQWQVEIRDANTLVVLADEIMSMTQDLDGP